MIRLISDLEPKFYINANVQNIIFKPKWNVSEHFNFQFHPKLRTTLSD